jgi:CheY-like chemotaxis protein
MPRVERDAHDSPVAAPSIVWSKSQLFERSRAKTREARHSARPALLWIDDFEPGLMLYKKMLEDLGFKVLTASTGEAGVKLAALYAIDVVVTDYEMPSMDGLGVAASVKALNPRTPVLLFSGSALVPGRARRLVDAFCDKAGPRSQLLAAIHRLLQTKRSQRLQPPPARQASDHGQRTVA